MLLVDRQLLELISSDVLVHADPQRVGAISYDLRTDYFAQEDQNTRDSFTLAPGESVFVACRELILMPPALYGQIVLRNSRIRAGLRLDAPVYQPGHHTRLFFRITNVTAKSMSFTRDADFASLMLFSLDSAPDHPYDGAFQKELEFNHLGDYRAAYKLELQEVEEKADSVRHIERTIYANVLTLMTIFIAIFSLINVNVDLAYAQRIDVPRMLVFNFLTVGSIAALCAFIQLITAPRRRWLAVVLLVIAAVLLAVGVAIAL